MSEPQERVDVGSLKDNFLECPVCVEHFNQTDRRPRLLISCLHAFCTQCLQQLLVKEGKGQITCPLCRQVQKVHGNAATLEVDGLRDKLVEFLQIKKDKKAHCSECPERNEAVSRCQECHSYLCKDCDFAHRRHRVSRDHVIMSLGDIIDQPITSFAKGHFCPKHPKHNLEFYCATEEKLCCVSCTVLDHKGHDLQQLEEASAARKAELETKLAQVHGHAHRLRNNKKQVKCQVKHIEDMRAKSLSDINTMFDHFKTVLEKRKLQLKTDVKQGSARLLSILQKNMESTDQTLAVIDSTDTYFAQAKEKADIVEMLQMYPAINRSLESLTETPTSLQLGIEQTMLDIRFVPQEASQIETLMASVGVLSRPMKGILAEGLVPQHLDDQTVGLTESGAAVAEGRNFTVKVYKESIVTLKLDVIVNAANGQLFHRGGVARIIANAAGQQLLDEGNSIVLQKGDIPVTDLAVTNSGNLPCRRVFHAVGPRWTDYHNKEKCLEDLCCTILRCLCEAVNRSFESIAFTSISSSIFGVPKELCAKMYVRALKSFDTAIQKGSLKEVHFVDVTDVMVKVIQAELQSSWTQPVNQENLEKDKVFIMKCLDSSTAASVTALKGTPGELKEKDKNAGIHWLGKSEIISLRIVRDDILKIEADSILSWVDTGFSTTSPLQKLMDSVGGHSYRRGRNKAYKSHKSWGEITEGTGGSLPQKRVIFALAHTSPTKEDVSSCLKKALDLCVKHNLTSLILTKHPSARIDVNLAFIETTVDQLIKLDQNERKTTLHVQIVEKEEQVVDGLMEKLQQYLTSCGLTATAITGKETELSVGEGCVICCNEMPDPVKLKCGHRFCKQCVDKCFKIKAVCPVCKMKCGVIKGNMPHGSMRDMFERYRDLPGFKGCGTIVITYFFYGGNQTEEHPAPGEWYKGISRTAYLPGNAEGKKVLALLKVAWKRRLTFTIGRSVTMGLDSCITWNEIHHKTNTDGGPTNHGYPDPDYLRRVQEELADQGVTEEDLGATGSTPV